MEYRQRANLCDPERVLERQSQYCAIRHLVEHLFWIPQETHQKPQEATQRQKHTQHHPKLRKRLLRARSASGAPKNHQDLAGKKEMRRKRAQQKIENFLVIVTVTFYNSA
jgi:hypothetical protein